VEAIEELRSKHSLPTLLAVSSMARSSYYYHKKRLKATDKYSVERAAIFDIYHQNKGRYGYRRITEALRRQGVLINHKTVSKLMLELGIKCEVRKKRYRSYKGEKGTIAENTLNRNFKAQEPNSKWATDVAVFSLFGQKLYLSPVIDLFNGEIISYDISDKPNLQQTMTMLEKAFQKIPDNSNLMLHSDQGWQYQHQTYRQALKSKGIIQSMSRKGNCLDNAVVENFFGHVKSELLYLQKFKSIKHFKRELNDYLEYYNNDRIKIKLNGLSPVKYRTQFLKSI
jgi:transposase InsO family protein